MTFCSNSDQQLQKSRSHIFVSLLLSKYFLQGLDASVLIDIRAEITVSMNLQFFTHLQ